MAGATRPKGRAGAREDEMARYSREAMKRSVAAGYAPPISCAACGQRFWSEQQKREHYGISAGKSYCQYAPAGPRP